MLNFFNAIMPSILSRRREFAVLQAVGMTKGQLKNMLICERLFYTLDSAIAASALSIVLNPLGGKLMENMFRFFSAHFTVLPLRITITVLALPGLAIPSVLFGSMKQSIVERLRESE